MFKSSPCLKATLTDTVLPRTTADRQRSPVNDSLIHRPLKALLAHPLERRYNDGAPLILNLDFKFRAHNAGRHQPVFLYA